MKVAISTDGEHVSAHFGRCPTFTIVEIQNGKVIQNQRIQNPGHHPGYLPKHLREIGVECIIAGGMGNRAAGLFEQYNIRPIVGITGKVEDVITRFVHGTLEEGESLCKPGLGKGYGLDKTECDHEENEKNPEGGKS
jgi:predicted Fe-Mo cluster-binding NifX family protein